MHLEIDRSAPLLGPPTGCGALREVAARGADRRGITAFLESGGYRAALRALVEAP